MGGLVGRIIRGTEIEICLNDRPAGFHPKLRIETHDIGPSPATTTSATSASPKLRRMKSLGIRQLHHPRLEKSLVHSQLPCPCAADVDLALNCQPLLS